MCKWYYLLNEDLVQGHEQTTKQMTLQGRLGNAGNMFRMDPAIPFDEVGNVSDV